MRSKDANLLAVKDGTIYSSKDWAKCILKRVGWVKRRSSTKAKVIVPNIDEIKQKFLQDVKNPIAMDEIPADMIIKWDQTGVNYIPVASWTMKSEGSKK